MQISAGLFMMYAEICLYYDWETVTEVRITFSKNLDDESVKDTVYNKEENLYQSLWQTYFDSVNIKARKNMKLHISAHAKTVLEIPDRKTAK
jgi:hypothetical protein